VLDALSQRGARDLNRQVRQAHVQQLFIGHTPP
jgi:hypothetical protein